MSRVDQRWLQVRRHNGTGFQSLVSFGAWRVAILNAGKSGAADSSATMERHTKTDEVFVLTRGRAILLLGGTEPQVQAVHRKAMEPGKIYNVRCNVWHTILLSRNASVLIVENRDTGPANSEHVELAPRERERIREIRKRVALR